MTGSSIVLDTSVAVLVLNDKPAVVSWLSGFAELLVPAVALGELRFGMLNSHRAQDNLNRLDRLVARCRVLDATATTADRYANVRLGLRQLGQPIPENDMWIAATAIKTGYPLTARDAHFSAIAGLRVLPPP